MVQAQSAPNMLDLNPLLIIFIIGTIIGIAIIILIAVIVNYWDSITTFFALVKRALKNVYFYFNKNAKLRDLMDVDRGEELDYGTRSYRIESLFRLNKNELWDFFAEKIGKLLSIYQKVKTPNVIQVFEERKSDIRKIIKNYNLYKILSLDKKGKYRLERNELYKMAGAVSFQSFEKKIDSMVYQWIKKGLERLVKKYGKEQEYKAVNILYLQVELEMFQVLSNVIKSKEYYKGCIRIINTAKEYLQTYHDLAQTEVLSLIQYLKRIHKGLTYFIHSYEKRMYRNIAWLIEQRLDVSLKEALRDLNILINIFLPYADKNNYVSVLATVHSYKPTPKVRNAFKNLTPLFSDFEREICHSFLGSIPNRPTERVFDHLNAINHKLAEIESNKQSSITYTLDLRDALSDSQLKLKRRRRKLLPFKKIMRKVEAIEKRRNKNPHWIHKEQWTSKEDFWRYLREYDKITTNSYAILEQKRLIMTIYHYLRREAKKIIKSSVPNKAAYWRYKECLEIFKEYGRPNGPFDFDKQIADVKVLLSKISLVQTK